MELHDEHGGKRIGTVFGLNGQGLSGAAEVSLWAPPPGQQRSKGLAGTRPGETLIWKPSVLLLLLLTSTHFDLLLQKPCLHTARTAQIPAYT